MRRAALMAVGLATALSTTACTQIAPGSAGQGTQSQLPVGTIDKATVQLRATSTNRLGEIVVDVDGYALYRFDRDTVRQRSNCVDACVLRWPPVVHTGNIQLQGVEQAQVGSVLRPDNTRQVTIGGWPVYRYSGDTGPGEIRGQGAGGTWFAVTPKGAKAGGAPGTTSVEGETP